MNGIPVLNESGAQHQVLLPWAAPDARFTTLFERFAIDVLTETDITGVCKILEISWDEGWHLIQRAVARGMARKERRVPTLIGVDEKAAAKGQRYLTLVCDLERATVEYIADERKQASLDGYFEALSEDERAQIKAVAMDRHVGALRQLRLRPSARRRGPSSAVGGHADGR